MWLNFSQVIKSFTELFSRDVPAILKFFDFFSRIYLKQLPLIPKSIFTGEYQQHQYTCFFILAFHIQLNMLYICANEIYVSNRCISSMIFLQYCNIFWNATKILKKLKAHTLEPQTSGLFGNLEATKRHSHYAFWITKYI